MCSAVVSRYAIEIAITTATPWLTTSPSGSSSSAAIAGSPRKPMPSEAIVMPELAGRQVLVDLVDLLQREGGAAHAVVAHLLEPRLPRAHEAELRGHEEAVRGDEHQHSGQEAGVLS